MPEMPVDKKECKWLKEFVDAQSGIQTRFGFFASKDNALLYAQDKAKKETARRMAKAKQVQVKKVKANRSAVVELNRKTLSWQHKRTQPVFNKLRRLQELKWFSDRDMEPTCISCQKPLGGDQWCNGHLKTVGSNGRLRYDFKNSYLQHNFNCNQQKSGDIDGYKKGLVARFGDKDAQSIIDYCEANNSPLKLSWQDVENLRVGFNKEIKDMKNQGV